MAGTRSVSDTLSASLANAAERIAATDHEGRRARRRRRHSPRATNRECSTRDSSLRQLLQAARSGSLSPASAATSRAPATIDVTTVLVAATAGSRARRRSAAHSSAACSGRRLLVVDDGERQRAFLARHLPLR